MNDLDLNAITTMTIQEVASLKEVHPELFEVFIVRAPREDILLLVCLN